MNTDPTKSHLPIGLERIRKALIQAPLNPGVYRMLDARGEVLYVGKAKSIKKRVTSYTQPNRQTNRLLRMIGLTRSMVFVTTHTEAEALLLEANLIKRHRPPFNILLRDDKSFPYILLREDHDWAQIRKHRGARKTKGFYYGPFASAGAVNRTLNTLQKVFLLRSCSDSVFDNRSRPCLLYQIKRCSAPCVDKISREDYAALVTEARHFLEGRDTGIQKRMATKMQAAAEDLEFETAARYRDRLRALSAVQSHQGVNAAQLGDTDVMAIAQKGGRSCVQVFFYRAGQNWGNRTYFPKHEADKGANEILTAFLGQFYEDKPPPKTIFTNIIPTDLALLQDALSLRADRRVIIRTPQRGDKKDLVNQALRNADQALDRQMAESASQARHLADLAECLDLAEPPARIEIYDNSHIMGTNALGAMVVHGTEGFEKGQYRKFNIKSETLIPGDDYAMMREVMRRRFTRLMTEDPDRQSGTWPDLLLIDGGRGQLSAVQQALDDLGVEDVPLLAISKGPDRNAGHEQFHIPGRETFSLPLSTPLLFFLQRLRDEAHRFAIGGQRARRKKVAEKSPLDGVPGIGAKRKKALLMHFGSARAVAQAGVRDLAGVDGISTAMAQTLYDHFHPNQ